MSSPFVGGSGRGRRKGRTAHGMAVMSADVVDSVAELNRWAALLANMGERSSEVDGSTNSSHNSNNNKSSFSDLLEQLHNLPMLDFNRLDFGDGVPHPLLSLIKVVPYPDNDERRDERDGKRAERYFVQDLCYEILKHGGRAVMPLLIDQINLANAMARDLWSIVRCILELLPLDDPKDMINAVDDQFGYSLFYWVVSMERDVDALLHLFPALDLEANLDACRAANNRETWMLLQTAREIAVPPYVNGQRTVLSLLLTQLFTTVVMPPELVNLIMTFLTNLPPGAKTCTP